MPKLTVYLAGPVSNCNLDQKLKWRKYLRRKLGSEQYEFIDPTLHEDDWEPKHEIVEIDRSDVVVANLWRESIGTVVGIIQARRRSKPVILIDTNYINSKVLEAIVGKDKIVHRLDAVPGKLENEILPSLQTDLRVAKKGGGFEPFSVSKLQRSINAACDDAKISDALFPMFVAKGALEILRCDKSDCLTTTLIRTAVLEFLSGISSGTDKLYPDELKDAASVLIETWQEQELVKGDLRLLRSLQFRTVELERLLTEREEELKLKDAEIASLALQLTRMECMREVRPQIMDLNARADDGKPENILEMLQDIARSHPQIVLLPSAIDTAPTCPPRYCNILRSALNAIAEYIRAIESGARPGNLSKWLLSHNCAVIYAGGESERTQKQPIAVRQRTVTFESKKYCLWKHLKFGKSRLYFEITDDYRVLLGPIGSHLTVASGD